MSIALPGETVAAPAEPVPRGRHGRRLLALLTTLASLLTGFNALIQALKVLGQL